MNIHKFNVPEMFSNTQGKTSMSMCCALILVLTGCFMGVKAVIDHHGEGMLQGLGFATLGSGLLGIRRFTKDKQVDPEADPKPKT